MNKTSNKLDEYNVSSNTLDDKLPFFQSPGIKILFLAFPSLLNILQHTMSLEMAVKPLLKFTTCNRSKLGIKIN